MVAPWCLQGIRYQTLQMLRCAYLHTPSTLHTSFPLPLVRPNFWHQNTMMLYLQKCILQDPEIKSQKKNHRKVQKVLSKCMVYVEPHSYFSWVSMTLRWQVGYNWTIISGWLKTLLATLLFLVDFGKMANIIWSCLVQVQPSPALIVWIYTWMNS